MKKIYFLLVSITFLLLFTFRATAQSKSLFVNDNNLIYYNTDTILRALTAAGIPFDIFNASDSLRSPSAAEMQPYSLVIWYCSTDGVGNYLWNGNDTDNPELVVYLANNGKLWLMGTDFLYDRYGSAPYQFETDEFPNSVLGISAYNVQSYGDDGGIGVPELDPEELTFYDFDTLQWIYPTAWWVDGVTPGENALPIYKMGPESYELQGYSSAVYHYHTFFQGEKELSFFFDPAIIDNFEKRVKLFINSYALLFMPPPPGFAELTKVSFPLITGKNPVSDVLECKTPESLKGNTLNISIYAPNGQMVYSHTNESRNVFNVDVSTFSPGIYFLTVSDKGTLYYQKFVVSR